MTTYKTIFGDVWDTIAYKVYGDSKWYSDIKNANPKYTEIILFDAGIELIIPAIERKENSQNTAPWAI